MLAALPLFFTACESPEDVTDLNPTAGPNLFKATFIDGKGEFLSEKEGPYQDGEVIKIVVPWFYPEESDNQTDISQMRIYSSLPNSVVIQPALQSMDLTKENPITVISPNGSKSTLVITGERRKSAAKSIKAFSLSNGMAGMIFEDKKMIGLIAGGLDLSGLSAQITVSPHATVSPDPSLPQDFNKPVIYTVTAHDGSTQEYTVQTFIPNKVPLGLRKGSGVSLWKKTLIEMGLSGTDNNTTAMASSSKYIFLNTRNNDMRYFDRFTGEYVGTIVLPFKSSLGNFCVANDDNDNLLVTNLRNAGGGKLATQTIYKIKGTGNPEKFIEASHIYPTGRKLSVRGNLDGDAIILSTVEVSSKVLYWEVKGGVLLSQDPKVYEADPATIMWNYVGDAITFGTDLSQGVFATGYGKPKAFGYFNADGSVAAKFDLEGFNFAGAALTDAGHIIQQLDFAEFNGAKYLALADMFWTWSAFAHLFDVTAPSNLGGAPNDESLYIFSTGAVSCNNNGNNVADVNLKVSSDGLKMILYVLGTNGGVHAYEFDCIDVDNMMQ